MDCLYASGFRGFNLRNSGPGDLYERAMGVKNEGMFTFTSSPATMNVIKSGLAKVNSFFVQGQTPSCSSSGGSNTNNGGGNSSSYKVNVISGSNDWWTQIEVLPTTSVQSVVFKCGSAATNLERPAWSQTQFVKGLSQQCPSGSDIQIIVNSKLSYPLKYVVGASSSSSVTSLADMIPFAEVTRRYAVNMEPLLTKHHAKFSFRSIAKLLDGEDIDMALMRCGQFGTATLRPTSSNVWEGILEGRNQCPIGTNIHLLLVLRNGHVEKYDLVYGYNNSANLL